MEDVPMHERLKIVTKDINEILNSKLKNLIKDQPKNEELEEDLAFVEQKDPFEFDATSQLNNEGNSSDDEDMLEEIDGSSNSMVDGSFSDVDLKSICTKNNEEPQVDKERLNQVDKERQKNMIKYQESSNGHKTTVKYFKNKQKPSLICDICNRKFLIERNLRIHYIADHKTIYDERGRRTFLEPLRNKSASDPLAEPPKTEIKQFPKLPSKPVDPTKIVIHLDGTVIMPEKLPECLTPKAVETQRSKYYINPDKKVIKAPHKPPAPIPIIRRPPIEPPEQNQPKFVIHPYYLIEQKQPVTLKRTHVNHKTPKVSKNSQNYIPIGEAFDGAPKKPKYSFQHQKVTRIQPQGYFNSTKNIEKEIESQPYDIDDMIAYEPEEPLDVPSTSQKSTLKISSIMQDFENPLKSKLRIKCIKQNVEFDSSDIKEEIDDDESTVSAESEPEAAQSLIDQMIEAPHQCLICQARFPYKSSLIIHDLACRREQMEKKKAGFKIKHKVIQAKRTFKCRKCKFETINLEAMSKHTIDKHIDVRCQQCKRIFKGKDRLNEHILSHEFEGFMCDECGEDFEDAMALERHKEILKCGQESEMRIEYVKEEED